MTRVRHVVLEDGAKLRGIPRGEILRILTSRGRWLGDVRRAAPRQWLAMLPTGGAVWEEATGQDWPTLRRACEALNTENRR